MRWGGRWSRRHVVVGHSKLCHLRCDCRRQWGDDRSCCGKSIACLLGGFGLFDDGSVDGELDGIDGWSSSEVVHACLESLLPTVEVHRGELTRRWVGEMDVERLRLVDERSSVGSEVDDCFLADLPDGLVNSPVEGKGRSANMMSQKAHTIALTSSPVAYPGCSEWNHRAR